MKALLNRLTDPFLTYKNAIGWVAILGTLFIAVLNFTVGEQWESAVRTNLSVLMVTLMILGLLLKQGERLTIAILVGLVLFCVVTLLLMTVIFPY